LNEPRGLGVGLVRMVWLVHWRSFLIGWVASCGCPSSVSSCRETMRVA